jgi:hypothetical protein
MTCMFKSSFFEEIYEIVVLVVAVDNISDHDCLVSFEENVMSTQNIPLPQKHICILRTSIYCI